MLIFTSVAGLKFCPYNISLEILGLIPDGLISAACFMLDLILHTGLYTLIKCHTHQWIVCIIFYEDMQLVFIFWMVEYVF